MNMKLYEAAQARMRSRALEVLADIEARLQGTSPDLDGSVEKIVDGAMALAQIEGAMLTLQQYFQPKAKPQQPTQPPPRPREEEILTVTPEMSPTYKKSLEKQKLKEARAKGRKKKDE